MKYYSTNHRSPSVDFKEAIIIGKPPDQGLYFPEEIPSLSEDFITNIDQYSEEEIAYEVILPYVKNIVPAHELVRILMETLSFKAPLIKVSKEISAMELFHGPTQTFKDLGARFMASCLEYLARDRTEKLIVLTATSGDSGGAIANALFAVEGVEVVILYPSGGINLIQEKQLATWGENIHAVEVKGTFEDCRQLVDQAFSDEELTSKLWLTCAGSANVATWLSYQFFYFFAYKQWNDKEALPAIAVPSGDLGNISAGLLAHLSGLPLQHFIAACNANDIVSAFLQTGKHEPKKTVTTISHAMNVGDPSNMARMMELFNLKGDQLRGKLSSISISDNETKATIKSVHHKNGYLLDPHSAVAYLALQRYIQQNPSQKGIIMKTAHPAKFFEIVEPIIEEPTPMPSSIELELVKEKSTYKINADFNVLKYFLLTV